MTLYLIGILIVLIYYISYEQIAALRWDESERRQLEQVELRLAHVLRILESPDVQWIMHQHKHRRLLFLELSEGLKEDVLGLLRSGRFRTGGLLLTWIFLLAYYLMRAKAYVFCGQRDLQFLSRLELVVLRATTA